MKKLNILKPDIKSGYLESGKGQEITYLKVPEDLTYEGLKKDVENGATQYKELLDLCKKKPSRFVIIECDNEEEGLTAVSYLAAIYNKVEKVSKAENYDFDDVSEELDISFEEFDALGLKNDEDDDEDWEEDSVWTETPWRIPVVDSSDLTLDDGANLSSFARGEVRFERRGIPRIRLPYWHYTRKENICIVHRVGKVPLAENPFEASMLRKLKRYSNNRHVFLVKVSNEREKLYIEEDIFYKREQSALFEIVLEYSAASIKITSEMEELRKYHMNLFENWVARYGYTLSGNFPVKKVVDHLASMNNEDKSGLMEKIIKYVMKENDTPRELKEEDFSILEKFKEFGLDFKSDKQTSYKKIQENLVGMESVKEQIKGIVEVMRYNKRREKMGLGTGNYHNVHMMLGAPGTAKTTIAEMLGNVMAEERLLRGNRYISINGAELKGMYVGQSAPKVRALFDEYDIIFIDEAYSISAESGREADSFSQEAIAQLIIELEKHGMDRLVVFAGYGGSNVSEKDNKMKKFLQSNPGIRSRINSTIYFESYTADEMVDIFRRQVKLGQFNVSKKVDPYVRDFFAERVGRDDFGNGREARSLLENSMVEAAKRLAGVEDSEITEKMMKEITLEDVKKAIEYMRFGAVTQFGRKREMGFRAS